MNKKKKYLDRQTTEKRGKYSPIQLLKTCSILFQNSTWNKNYLSSCQSGCLKLSKYYCKTILEIRIQFLPIWLPIQLLKTFWYYCKTILNTRMKNICWSSCISVCLKVAKYTKLFIKQKWKLPMQLPIVSVKTFKTLLQSFTHSKCYCKTIPST